VYNAPTPGGLNYVVAFRNQLAISNITFGFQVTEFINKNPFARAQIGARHRKFLRQFALGLPAYVK
jgi:hypothetical protein